MRDQKFRLAALEPVGDVGWPERRHRRDQHEAELHRRQHRRPQFGTTPSIIKKPIAALGAERAQAVGETRRLLRSSSKRPRLDAIADDLERGLVPMLSRRELGVEPVERPVEPLRPRPDEGGARAVIVVLSSSSRSRASRNVGGCAGRVADGRGRRACPDSTSLDGTDAVAPTAADALHGAVAGSSRPPNPSKPSQTQVNPSKIAWFCLVLFVRIGTFQWVTAISK